MSLEMLGATGLLPDNTDSSARQQWGPRPRRGRCQRILGATKHKIENKRANKHKGANKSEHRATSIVWSSRNLHSWRNLPRLPRCTALAGSGPKVLTSMLLTSANACSICR